MPGVLEQELEASGLAALRSLSWLGQETSHSGISILCG